MSKIISKTIPTLTITTEYPKVLLIDNYDSFTYNIVQYLLCLGVKPIVVKNDQLEIEDLLKIPMSHLIISPGPGSPKESGVCSPLLAKLYSTKLPILGVCLGHQIIAEFFGCKVIHAKEVQHGKISVIQNTGEGIFAQLPENFKVTRYHSLIVESLTVSSNLLVTAWHKREDGDDEIMSIQHKSLPIFGVQFHPEAIMSEYGLDLFRNFLSINFLAGS